MSDNIKDVDQQNLNLNSNSRISSTSNNTGITGHVLPFQHLQYTQPQLGDASNLNQETNRSTVEPIMSYLGENNQLRSDSSNQLSVNAYEQRLTPSSQQLQMAPNSQHNQPPIPVSSNTTNNLNLSNYLHFRFYSARQQVQNPPLNSIPTNVNAESAGFSVPYNIQPEAQLKENAILNQQMNQPKFQRYNSLLNLQHHASSSTIPILQHQQFPHVFPQNLNEQQNSSHQSFQSTSLPRLLNRDSFANNYFSSNLASTGLLGSQAPLTPFATTLTGNSANNMESQSIGIVNNLQAISSQRKPGLNRADDSHSTLQRSASLPVNELITKPPYRVHVGNKDENEATIHGSKKIRRSSSNELATKLPNLIDTFKDEKENKDDENKDNTKRAEEEGQEGKNEIETETKAEESKKDNDKELSSNQSQLQQELIAAKRQKSREKNRLHSRKSRLKKKDYISKMKDDNSHLQIFKLITEAIADMITLHDLTDEARIVYANLSFLANYSIQIPRDDTSVSSDPTDTSAIIPMSFLHLLHEEDKSSVVDCLRLVRRDPTQAPILRLRMFPKIVRPDAADGSNNYIFVQSRIQACIFIGAVIIVTRPLSIENESTSFPASIASPVFSGGVANVSTSGFVIQNFSPSNVNTNTNTNSSAEVSQTSQE